MKRRIFLILGLLSVLLTAPLWGMEENLSSSGMGNEEKLFSMDFKDADLQDVLRILSQESGLNIVAGKDVGGKITISFINVTIGDALNSILRANGFGLKKEANILRVIPAKPEVPPTITKIFALTYINAENLKESLGKLISEYGQIQVFNPGEAKGRSDILIITDTPEKIESIAALVKELDTPPSQVRIEAKVIEVVLSKGMDLGIAWNIQASAKGAIKPTEFPFKTKGSDFPTPTIDDFTFGTLNFESFTATLQALETSGKSNLLSSPSITTLNNKEAKIMVGDVIPIPKYEFNRDTGTWEITGYDEKDIGITLTVTPRVNKDNSVIMDVTPEVSEITGWKGQFNERPVTSTRRATTQVRIKDRETLVIGGLLKKTETKGNTGVPLLSRIPVLGYLFGKKSTTEDKTDLLIFITPHILTEKSIKK